MVSFSFTVTTDTIGFLSLVKKQLSHFTQSTSTKKHKNIHSDEAYKI